VRLQLIKVGSRQRTALGDFLSRLRAEAETEEPSSATGAADLALAGPGARRQPNSRPSNISFCIRDIQRDFWPTMSTWRRSRAVMRPECARRGRFEHLLAFPCVSAMFGGGYRGAGAGHRRAAAAQLPGELESWLEKAPASLYRSTWTGTRTTPRVLAATRRSTPLWSYVVPGQWTGPATLALAPQVRELESLQAKARSQKCADVAPLDFQPMCRSASTGPMLRSTRLSAQFEALSDRLEKDLALFFQQARVKSKVREWTDLKLELNTQTLSYLEGKAEVPHGRERRATSNSIFPASDLSRSVPANALLDLIGERTWEKSALLKELGQFLDRVGPASRSGEMSRCPGTTWSFGVASRACGTGLRCLPALAEGARPWAAWGDFGLIGLESTASGISRRWDWVKRRSSRYWEWCSTALVRLPGSRIALAGLSSRRPTLCGPSVPRRSRARGADASLYRQNRRFLKLRPTAWLARTEWPGGQRSGGNAAAAHEVLQGRLGPSGDRRLPRPAAAGDRAGFHPGVPCRTGARIGGVRHHTGRDDHRRFFTAA